LVEKTGRPGEVVDDLQEVSITDLEYKSALSCWRSCHGLRLYRSKTVREALRLICSAPVPGLGGISYLEVINTLTKSGWEHHIFLSGGLVRDILRREVGNDVDITFSAPAAELAQSCQEHGYKCTLEGDYILIGDAQGPEYMEGMVMTHNAITPPQNSDFSMNWVFYDFCNDVVIDKTGFAVPAVIANRCEIPCPRDLWDSWVAINGSRVLFRYYKFLVRGYEYVDLEMAYIAERLLDFWSREPETTVAKGREVLGSMLLSQDKRVDRLRQLVSLSFSMVAKSQRQGCFPSANSWWQTGWLHLQPQLADFSMGA